MEKEEKKRKKEGKEAYVRIPTHTREKGRGGTP